MQDFAFIDETLDRNLTHTYHLSIQVSLDGLSFCILDPVTNKYIVLQHYILSPELQIEDTVNRIDEIISANDILYKKQYKSVRLIWVSEKSLMVPEKLFEKDNLKLHFSFNFKLDDLDEIHYNHLQYIDTYNVFVIPNLIANIFLKHFPAIQFYSQQQVLIDDILAKSLTEKARIAANIHNSFIDIVITENHKLKFVNSFRYKSDTDIAYFILLVFDQFKLIGETNELILYGLIEKNSKTLRNLGKYIKHIKFDQLPEEFTYSYTINKIAPHNFSNLFRLHLCE